MSSRIPHSKPTVGLREAQAIARVIESGHPARGAKCEEFERELAMTIWAPQVHALTSGTAALHLALLATGAEAGKNVLLPSLACAALLNAVRYTGATPVLYDSGYDWDASLFAQLDRTSGDKTAAVIIVASPGRAQTLDAPENKEGFAAFGAAPVILDRCQQLSGEAFAGTPAAFEVLSFYATKCISTATGGAVACRRVEDHLAIVDLTLHDKRDSYPRARYNYQFDDIRAAMGIEQLAQLPQFTAARKKQASAYAAAFGRTLKEEDVSGMAFRYLHDCGSLQALDKLEDKLAYMEIETKRPVFKPLHRYLGLPDKDFPKAMDAWGRMLSLPLYPALTDAERKRVCEAVRDAGG